MQRTWVHAVARDGAGGVLLVPAAAGSPLAGRWILPGGRLRHGEHPRDGVIRALTGYGLRAIRPTPAAATADLVELAGPQVSLHTIRLVYDVEVVPPVAVPAGGRFARAAEAVQLPLAPFVAEILGLPEPAPLNAGPPELVAPSGGHAQEDVDEVQPRPAPPASGPGRDEMAVPVQRPAAYAVLVDGYDGPASRSTARMLLTRLAGSENTWTLPGGGIDHGEHPLVALVRELWEEAGLPYTVGPLIDIGSRHFTGRARDGRLEDFQGIRLVYAGSVPTDRVPTVVEVNGSTDATAWIPLTDLERMGAVPAAREALARWVELTERGALRDAG